MYISRSFAEMFFKGVHFISRLDISCGSGTKAFSVGCGALHITVTSPLLTFTLLTLYSFH